MVIHVLPSLRPPFTRNPNVRIAKIGINKIWVVGRRLRDIGGFAGNLRRAMLRNNWALSRIASTL